MCLHTNMKNMKKITAKFKGEVTKALIVSTDYAKDLFNDTVTQTTIVYFAQHVMFKHTVTLGMGPREGCLISDNKELLSDNIVCKEWDELLK